MNGSRYEMLLKVIETGSITRTAEYYNYTQSAVSQAVKHLEEELGVRIFNRKNRTIELTKDGEYLLPAIREIVTGERQLIDRTSEIQKLQTGVIRIGAYTSMSCHWLPQRLSRFREKYPNVNFELRQGDSQLLRGWLKDGTVDVLFIMDLHDKDFDFIKLFEDKMVVLVPPDHPLAKRKTINVKDLKNRQLIMPESDYDMMLQKMFADSGFDPEIAFMVKEDYTIMSMVENRLGVSILPEYVLQRNPYDIKILPLRKGCKRELGIMMRRGEPLSWAVEKFIEFAVHS
ncbi:MAG: LysR family transcriptional regulator [Eubacteriaceae bacterium]|nr:LysR family transcriptional regulator [Eubacteriaceae bacterium]